MSKYTNKYERYTNLHQESRFATPEEIRESGKMIDLREKCVRYGGIPLLCDTSRTLVDDADHHSIIFGATGSGKTRRFILIYMIILIKASFSLIVIDVKGELKKRHQDWPDRWDIILLLSISGILKTEIAGTLWKRPTVFITAGSRRRLLAAWRA